MAKVKQDKNIIKANVVSKGEPIKANIVQNEKTIKANPTKIPSATTEVKGIVRLATDDEALEGVSKDTAITPHTLKLATNFVFEQAMPSKEWEIEHPLNKQPNISVTDTAGNTQAPDEIIYNSNNSITVKFVGSFAGYAILN